MELWWILVYCYHLWTKCSRKFRSSLLAKSVVRYLLFSLSEIFAKSLFREYKRNASNEEPLLGFQTFSVQVFKIALDSRTFSILLLYILWNDWSICTISGLNEQLQQELEYTLLKPDCHSWWISKRHLWTWGHFRRTICNKIVF